MWERNEIENYVATRRTLERYAAASAQEATPGPLFAESEQARRIRAMRRSIEAIEAALKRLGKGLPWEIRASMPATISSTRSSRITSRGLASPT